MTAFTLFLIILRRQDIFHGNMILLYIPRLEASKAFLLMSLDLVRNIYHEPQSQ